LGSDLWHLVTVAHGNEAAGVGQLRRQAGQQFREAGVEEHVAIFGMVQDVADLLRE
jgi:hypothetical protein